jgi:hypothetical protein
MYNTVLRAFRSGRTAQAATLIVCRHTHDPARRRAVRSSTWQTKFGRCNIDAALSSLGRRALVPRRHRAAKAVVDPQSPSVRFLFRQNLQGLLRTRHIREVRMRKASWLTSSSVDGDSHINDIANAPEQVVQILVRHLEGHVADEECLGRWVLSPADFAVEACAVVTLSFHLFCGVGGILYDNTAAFVELLVHGFNGRGGAIDVVKIDIAESA